MLTKEKLKRLLHYNEYTGVFTWLISTAKTIKPNSVAGSPNSEGYINIQVNKKSYKAHRLAFLYMKGYWPIEQIDHINGIRKDNTWKNLREASHSQNQQNSFIQTNKKVAVKGITYRDETYNRAAIYIASVKCLGVVYTKAISVINGRLDEDIIEELTIWLGNTRKTLHKEFTNNGELSD